MNYAGIILRGDTYRDKLMLTKLADYCSLYTVKLHEYWHKINNLCYTYWALHYLTF